MTDPTGRMDRPGAGPLSVNLAVDGASTGYYSNPNPETGRVEIVKRNPRGTPDAVVKEFRSLSDAKAWLKRNGEPDAYKSLRQQRRARTLPRFR